MSRLFYRGLFLQLIFSVLCLHSLSANTILQVSKDTLNSKPISQDILLKSIIFVVDKWDVPSGSDLDYMAKMVNMISSDSTVTSWHVVVKGAASPEGPLSRNILLGRNRARQLSDYLATHVPGINSSNMVVINAQEDWDSLVAALDTVDFKGKERILEIIDLYPDKEKRKKEIKAIDGGVTWRKLIRELFPPIRYARAYLHYEKPAPQKPQIPIKESPIALLEQPLQYEINRQYPTPLPPQNWFIALKTNALFLSALTSNLGFEVGFSRRWSVDVPVWYSPYDITETTRLRLLATQPELRWWLKDNMWRGHFVGIHGSIIGFNVSINNRGRFQDPNRAAWGLGLGYGYAMCFGKQQRFGMEFNVGAGFISYEYDVYKNRYNGQKFDSGSGSYWGLTRAGISLYYRWYLPKNRRK